MSGFSTYAAQNVINLMLRGQAYAAPGNHYLALFSSDPTDDNVTSNEVAGAWYARQSTGSWSAPIGTGNASSNSTQIQFSAVTGAAVTVSYWAIYDASTSGNMLFSGALSSSKTLNIGDVLVCGASQLVITFE